MQLTRQSEIAIGMLVSCAREPGRYLHTNQAAVGTGASKEYAAKVAHLLLRAGFVVSARGRNGGIRLVQSAERVSVGAVLRAMQPELCLVSRRGGQENGRETGQENGMATLTSIFEAGWRGFVDLMDGFSIADLLAERAPPWAACNDCRLKQTRTMHLTA